MSVEDHLAVAKFQKLVDGCNSKEEVLDLCFKALKKYRPAALEPPKPYPLGVQRSHNMNTYMVRASQSVDMNHLKPYAAAEYEASIKFEISRKLTDEMVRNNLIKFESHTNQQMFQQVFIGSLEVVI